MNGPVANDDDLPEDDDFDGFDEDGLDDETLEGLRGVARLAKLAAALPWFASVGRPLSPEETDLAEAACAGFGFFDARIGATENWAEAAEQAEAQSDEAQADPAFWEAEEQARHALLDQAGAIYPQHELMVALTHAATKAGEAARRQATRMAKPGRGFPPEEWIQAASAAAAQAAYQAALVLAAEAEDDHPFALKFRLFERGRWPLGLIGNTYSVF
jgi:hypothetical protein